MKYGFGDSMFKKLTGTSQNIQVALLIIWIVFSCSFKPFS